jgi:hypothetical protein
MAEGLIAAPTTGAVSYVIFLSSPGGYLTVGLVSFRNEIWCFGCG